MIQLEQGYKSFSGTENTVLHNINLQINEGEFVSLLGRSGSGKSTLLYIMSTLDVPSQGRLLIDNILVAENGKLVQNEKEVHAFRNQHLGFVFQFHYLLPELTALENVLMPTFKQNLATSKENEAKKLLKDVGLEGKFHRLPRELSGGEQQRVAIARALIMKPKYLFTDEPTGNLDSVNGDRIMDLLKQFNSRYNTTIIMVTHDPDYAKLAKRQVHLADGKVVNS